ncbi:disease resistance protein Roq1-like [Bidens hawaiensis]|uniref:disease resistance protein Roq1-like n=1 Tax=Bidens hawaiensis TaxID=980011 RepID=UPI0040496B47
MLKIRSRLCHKKVVIVLDDVTCHKHLEALADLVIDATYNITLLNDEEAIQLFSRHAQHEDHGKLILSQNVISYAGRLPSALKALGQFLCDKDVCEWLNALTRLQDIPDDDFIKRLKITYNSLISVQQELFLDIACVFRHWPKDEAMMILDACGFHPVIGVKVLLQKALITEFPYEDIVNMCTSSATLENNKIQVLHSPNGVAPSNIFEVVAKMKKLRSINVRQDVKTIVEEPPFLSNWLCWISWEGYPARLLPTDFQAMELVGLKFKNGLQEKLWAEFKYIPSLKVLDLHGSDNLITTPDFSGLPNLETLVLSSCKSLREIHSSIGSHEKLVYLDLDDCKKLEMFPPIITMQKLETLVLSGCSRLVNFPDIRQTMDSPKHLNMDCTGIDVVPSSVRQYCTDLESLSVIGCTKLDAVHLDLCSSPKSQSNRKLSVFVGGGK